MAGRAKLNAASLSKEMQQLISLLSGETKKIEQVDWGAFIELSKHHRVFPQLHEAMKGPTLEWIPPEVASAIGRLYRNNIYRMLQLSGEMERLCRQFAAKGVRTLLLKGPILAYELYGSMSLRTSSDLDVLIPRSELERADLLLTELGYCKEEEIESVMNDWTWRHHHVNYVHSHNHIKIEVHWRLHPGPAKEPDFEELWARRRRSEVVTGPAYFLGKEDLLLFLLAHGARHGWSRLRWLLDIDRLCRQHPDWPLIQRRADQIWQTQLVGQGLILCRRLLGTPLQEGMAMFMRRPRSRKLAEQAMFYLERRVNLHSPPLPEEVAAYHSRHLLSLMSWRQRGLFMISLLHPLTRDQELLPLPKSLHFLYFPLRPVLWAYRRTRKLSSEPEGSL